MPFVASRIVEADAPLMLSAHAFELFVSACENPAQPTAALRELMSRGCANSGDPASLLVVPDSLTSRQITP